MAISPPSDIVLDVARAVDPAGVAAARADLARRVGISAPGQADAAFSVTATAPGDMRSATPATQAPETFKRFEAVVLQNFIEAMMPEQADAVYGPGLAGDMWKSMMSGKIADVVADRGGIGIASRLLADHYVDGEVRAPLGPVSQGPERSELDRQTLLSDALVQQLQLKTTRTLESGDGSAS